MWRLVGTCLKNKEGIWSSSDNWSVPLEEGVPGNITNSSKNTVLSVANNDKDPGTSVIEKNLVQNDVRQIWVRGKAAGSAYYTLLNPNSGKYLTATSTGLKIEGEILFFIDL